MIILAIVVAVVAWRVWRAYASWAFGRQLAREMAWRRIHFKGNTGEL
jgi:hypothetical protein